MPWPLGTRSRLIYTALRQRILSGELAPGTKLPSLRDLTVQFGVAPLTISQVLGYLEADGLVAREWGRGTFVRAAGTPAVLVAIGHEPLHRLVQLYVTHAGYRSIAVEDPAAGLEALDQDSAITLLVASARGGTAHSDLAFIRTTRERWPTLPLVVLTDGSADVQ